MSFSVKCAQLDLARQKESVSFIKSFIDFLADNGYNMLHLYIEDRIKTATYPYCSDDESYSPDEIREIVSYGESRNIELFPCVGTLGHGERFLKHRELWHLAELRGGRKGRFGGTTLSEFCPSLPETLEFLGKYLAEVAELFPSKYFHVGLDEVFDFVICDKCREAAPDYHGEGRLFLNYALHIYNILKKLGKRMVMWTDMIEFYPEILPEFPRDIVMNDWQYLPDVRALRDHFNNSKLTSLDKYEKLGFEVWICPADRIYSNGLTCLQYASQYKCVKGGLLTSWEKTDTYLYRQMPIFAAFGRLLNGAQPDEAFASAVTYIFPQADQLFISSLRLALDNCYPRHFESCGEPAIFGRERSSLPFPALAAWQVCATILKQMDGKTTAGSFADFILQDLQNSTAEIICSLQMNICAANIMDFGQTAERLAEFHSLCTKFLNLYDERAAMWEKIRPGVPNFFTGRLPRIREQLQGYEKVLSANRFLRLRQAHMDWYGVNNLAVSLEIDGKYQQVWTGCAKPRDLDHTQDFDFYIPLEDEKMLDATAMRLEYHGYGGVGLEYACLLNHGRLAACPSKLLAAEGEAYHPEYVLDDDSKASFLGSQDMRETYIHKELFDKYTSITVSLQKQQDK